MIAAVVGVCESAAVRTWAPVLKTIATLAVGLPLIALVTWLAASRLYLGLSTG